MPQDFGITEEIVEAVKRAPKVPGCYIWKSTTDEILYVGKANELRNRLNSYLAPSTYKTTLLMENASQLEWITTETSRDALLLEAEMVKKFQPRFNVRLKDDKRYPYICVSTSEMYPQIFITRQVKNDKDKYFGPFTNVKATRHTLDLIHKIFPIRKVRQTLPLSKPRRPCMNFSIGRCLAPCQGNVNIEEYAKIVDEVLLFLEGKREILEDRITRRMNDYSDTMEFEKASIYRDVLANIRRATERQSVMSPGGGEEDVIGFAQENDQGQIALLEIREGRVIGRKTFPLVGLSHADEEEIYTSFLRDYYTQMIGPPSKIVVGVRLKDKKDIESLLTESANREVKITTGGPSSESQALIRMANANASLLLEERILATKMKKEKEALADLQELLKLDAPPTIIECYDISHFQGTETVASGVQFQNGKPNKSQYRKYKIKSVDGIDDPASMREVIGRRLQKLVNENLRMPDLIVIDGGLTQLAAAVSAAEALGLADLSMIGLAKQREEVYLPGRSEPLSPDKNRPGMLLIRNLRDEAHRFAVTFHKSRRDKGELEHLLLSMPDIGRKRLSVLLKHLKDKRIQDATIEEIQSIPGFGEELATRIVDFFAIS